MSALHNIRMLARYTQWANQRLYQAIMDIAEVDLYTPRPGRPRGLGGILGHMYVVDRIWKGHLQGQDHGFGSRALEYEVRCAELAALQFHEDQWYVDLTETLTETAWQGKVRFRFIGGEEGCLARGDILLHVVNHKTYHRGYVADMLYDMGRKPPTMDLPVFLRDVPQLR